LTGQLAGDRASFHPILDFGEGVAGTCFIKVAARSTADAERTIAAPLTMIVTPPTA
jgi:hypothetical protein